MKNLAYFSPSLEVEKTQKLPQNASFCHFDPLFGLCFAHSVPLVRLPPAFASQYALSNTSCWQGCQVGYPITHRYPPPLQRRLRSVFWGGRSITENPGGIISWLGGCLLNFCWKIQSKKRLLVGGSKNGSKQHDFWQWWNCLKNAKCPLSTKIKKPDPFRGIFTAFGGGSIEGPSFWIMLKTLRVGLNFGQSGFGFFFSLKIGRGLIFGMSYLGGFYDPKSKIWKLILLFQLVIFCQEPELEKRESSLFCPHVCKLVDCQTTELNAHKSFSHGFEAKQKVIKNAFGVPMWRHLPTCIIFFIRNIRDAVTFRVRLECN